MLHAVCVQRWQDVGKNSCPLCRATVLTPVRLEVEYPVEAIVKRRFDFRSNRYYFKVRWSLSPALASSSTVDRESWEPESNLRNCSDLLLAYETANPRDAVRRSPRFS